MDTPHNEILKNTLSFNINYSQNINDTLTEASENDGIVKVRHIPGGCMLIKRELVELLIQKYPEKKYSPCGNDKVKDK